jgi:2-haloacid dehalogenase
MIQVQHSSPVKAVLFDAYGTLFDVYSIGVLLEHLFPAHGMTAASLWRDKQIEYTRLVTTSNNGAHYQPFDALTLAALRYTCAKLGLDLSAAKEGELMSQYLQLSAFPDALATLNALKTRGLGTGVLSNGTPNMLASAIQSAGLGSVLDHVLSVDTLNPPQYKTAPRAYALGESAFGLPAHAICFVSSNSWDALAATWFGYQTVWVNRAHAPFERLGEPPTHTISTLSDLLTIV